MHACTCKTSPAHGGSPAVRASPHLGGVEVVEPAADRARERAVVPAQQPVVGALVDLLLRSRNCLRNLSSFSRKMTRVDAHFSASPVLIYPFLKLFC